MAITTQNTNRTTHLLALMKQGDDAFNTRDFEGMKAVHHPNLVAHVAGEAEPIKGQPAHAAMMKEMFRIFPDVHVHNDPYPIQFGSGDWITVITRATGTFTGEMILHDGKVIVRLRLRHDRQVGRRPAHRRVRLLGLRSAGAADRTGLVPSSGKSNGHADPPQPASLQVFFDSHDAHLHTRPR
jgi:hypothetical protein